MALTRKMLKAMGIDEEKIDQIIEAHTESTDALKADRDRYKADADKLPGIQQELDGLKAQGGDDWKQKHDTLQAEFDQYKSTVQAEKSKAAKESAYRAMLKDANLSERGIEKAVKYADWDAVELDEGGKLKNAAGHVKSVKEDWAEYVTTTTTTGARTERPPVSVGVSGSVKTKEEIYKMENGRYVLSASERQAELAKLYQHEQGE